jgi:hypothetical protein
VTMGDLGLVTHTFTTRGGEVFRGNGGVWFWNKKSRPGDRTAF